MTKNTSPLESWEQAMVVRWAWAHSDTRLHLLHSSGNGIRCTIRTAKKAKLEGMQSGVPDLFLPAPTAEYHGLFIEMKRVKSGKTSAAQIKWIEQLNQMGYYAAVCPGHQAAIKTIQIYLGI